MLAGRLVSANSSPLYEQLNNRIYAFIDGQRVRSQNEVRVDRLLVGRRDARELLDLTCPGFFVVPLHVPLLAYFERALAVDLEEIRLLNEAAHPIALGAEGRNESGHRDHPGINEKLRHLPDPANVLVAVLSGKSEVGAEPMPYIVAVEDKGTAALTVEPFPLPRAQLSTCRSSTIQ